MNAKLKKKIWKVLRMIVHNNGAPLVSDEEVKRINNDFLVKQYISFCTVWKYYLSLLEEEEEYEICAEILKIVGIQQNFLSEIAALSGIKEPGLDHQLSFVRHNIIDSPSAAA